MANVTKLEAVLDYIRTHPKEHDQEDWAVRTPCGTTMCFAGTTVALAGYALRWDARMFEPDTTQVAASCVVPDEYAGPRVAAHLNVAWVHEVATHELDLDRQQAHDLFWAAKTFDDVEEMVKDIINDNQECA